MQVRKNVKQVAEDLRIQKKARYATMEKEIKEFRSELAAALIEVDMLKKATTYFVNLHRYILFESYHVIK